MVNKYAGTCAFCKGTVQKGYGTCFKNFNGKWAVAHNDCLRGDVRQSKETLDARDQANRDFDARDHSSYEDRACGDTAYEDRCWDAVNY